MRCGRQWLGRVGDGTFLKNLKNHERPEIWLIMNIRAAVRSLGTIKIHSYIIHTHIYNKIREKTQSSHWTLARTDK